MARAHLASLLLAAFTFAAAACASGTSPGISSGGKGGASTGGTTVTGGGGSGSTTATGGGATTSTTSSSTTTSSTTPTCTGACTPGATDQQGCPWGSPATRTCQNDCTWGPFSACTKPIGWRDMAPSSTAGVPGRSGGYAFWTGSVMLVWGGQGADAYPAAYDPDADTWKKLAPAPIGGQAVWTGTTMAVISSSASTPPAVYDPATDQWTTLPGTMPLASRGSFAFVVYMPATNEVLGWGGYNNPTEFNDGAAYNLTTKTWRTIAASTQPASDGYYPPGAVWNGSRVIVYGGGTLSGKTNAASAYDPVADTWASLPSPPQSGYTNMTFLAVGATRKLALFWSGDQYGGLNPNYPANDGALWDDTAAAWTAVPGIPGGGSFNGHDFGASFSAGTVFGVWGGKYYDNGFQDDGTGAVFELATSKWTQLPPGGPSPRRSALAVWTGSEAIVWAGNGLDDGKIWRACDAAGGAACTSGALGACANGTFACTGGEPSCVPSQPTPEVCNGIDDDCNGAVDDVPLGAACSTGLLGPCATGAMGCVNGAAGCVQTVQPTAEVCNGIDDDCNGLVDDLATTQCSTGKPGPCALGTTTCVGGTPGCKESFPPTQEVCNGIDDDCNGIVDDNPAGEGQACSTGQSGTCATGTQHCTGGVLTCVPPSGC